MNVWGIELYGQKRRYIMKLANKAIPFDLQFFAEPGVDPTPPTPSEDPAPGEIKTFDDLLKDKTYQSEFDKRINKALETAKGKWDTDAQQKIADARTEAEKLSRLTADEKARYEREKQDADFNKRLADLTGRELKATAKETLAEKGLPLDLADVLNYADADTCSKSIAAVEKAFRASVEKAVNEKLRGTPPKSGAGNNSAGNPWSKEHFNLTEQGKILKENPELAKQLMSTK